jgi:hypothetical protein
LVLSCVWQQVQAIENAQTDQMRQSMILKPFDLVLSNSKRCSPMRVGHSRYKQEINLVLASVYKNELPHITVIHHVSKTHLTLVFLSKFYQSL